MKNIFMGELVTAKYFTSDSKPTNQYYELQQLSLVEIHKTKTITNNVLPDIDPTKHAR